MITDVTAKVTFDRCICVCSYESLLTGLPYIVCSCNRIESNAEESGVAACVTAAVRLDQHCSQTGLHGEEPQMRESELTICSVQYGRWLVTCFNDNDLHYTTCLTWISQFGKKRRAGKSNVYCSQLPYKGIFCHWYCYFRAHGLLNMCVYTGKNPAILS